MRKLAVGGETTQAAFAGPALRVIVSYKWQRIGKRALCSRACDRAFASLLFPFLLLSSCLSTMFFVPLSSMFSHCPLPPRLHTRTHTHTPHK